MPTNYFKIFNQRVHFLLLNKVQFYASKLLMCVKIHNQVNNIYCYQTHTKKSVL